MKEVPYCYETAVPGTILMIHGGYYLITRYIVKREDCVDVRLATNLAKRGRPFVWNVDGYCHTLIVKGRDYPNFKAFIPESVHLNVEDVL